MSISCPRCNNSIEQDFGVITCSKCNAVLFVDMEGHVQVSGDAQAPTEFNLGAVLPEMNASPSAVVEPPMPQAPPPTMEAMVPPPQMPTAPQPMPAPPVPPKAMPARPLPAPPPRKGFPQGGRLGPGMPGMRPGPRQAGMRPQPGQPGKRLGAGLPGMAMPQLHRKPAPPPPVSQHDDGDTHPPEPADASTLGFEILQSGNLDEVSDFGNTQQDFGALSYYVIIENIDTSATRQKLLEALSDEKFQWDPREVIASIRKGRLRLGHLNPVKASILVRRLQDVPVKVSWVQKLL